jgi:urea carboxylase-associated protein 1
MSQASVGPQSSDTLVPGNVIQEDVLPPGRPWAGPVRKGQVIRLIDIEGQQVGDFVCFNLDRLDEKFSPPNTANLNRTIRLTAGNTLYSDEASKMFTIIADTVGLHDVLAGACSRFTNLVRYGVPDTANCRDNFAEALAPHGIGWKDVPYAFNIFMNVPIGADASMTIAEPISRAGDYIDLRADMDCLVAISNCPQTRNACNAGTLKPLRVVVYEPAVTNVEAS